MSALLTNVRTLDNARDDWIPFRQHERWVEEVNVHLQLDEPITASVSENRFSGRLGSVSVMRDYVVFVGPNIYDP